MFQSIRQFLLPTARSIKYGRMLRRAISDASKPKATPLSPPVGFVLGCGRSGPTILGKLLSTHQSVLYLREPYYLWRAIDPSTDMIRFFGNAKTAPCCIMGDAYVSDESINRFNACMQAELRRCHAPDKRVIEKTPINAMRIPFLDGLSPKSPILHLVRNGIDVVRSIHRLASTNTYHLGGKGDWNQWWGRDNCKWDALALDAKNANWFKDEIPLLQSNLEMGALEWLISLGEINEHRTRLGDRLIEVRYSDLTSDPATQLHRICNHFEIEPEEEWLHQSCQQLDSARKNSGDPLELPPKMCRAFNHFQDQYGFEGHAVEKT